jgi:hypothetical protein
MQRVPAEDKMQAATVINGREYRTDGHGFFHMPDKDAERHLVASGYGHSWQVAPPVSPRLGYRCPECGHGSYFRTCKCGADCVPEA